MDTDFDMLKIATLKQYARKALNLVLDLLKATKKYIMGALNYLK